MATAGGIRAGRAYIEFLLDASALERGLKVAQQRLNDFGRSLQDISLRLGAMVAPLTAAIGVSARTFSSFDDVMRAVASVSGATGAELERLRATAEELGRTTSYTASQVGDAMLNLARAGFTPGQITAMIGPILNLARATGTDLATSADIAGVAIRSFGLSADDTSLVADILVATANNSAQSLTDLAEALKYAAPAAADAGMTLEDTALTIGIMANYGIRGSMAGTALRQALLKLANPDIQRQLRQVFGVIPTTAEGRIRKLHEVLKDLDRAMAGLTAAERVAAMQELFDLRGMTVGLKVAGADISQLEQAIHQAAGIAAQTAEQMDAGLGGAMRRLASAAEGLQIAIGKQLSPGLMSLGDRLTEVVGRITELVQTHGTWVSYIAAAVAAIAGLAVAVGSLSLVVRGLAGALNAVLAVLRLIGITNPFLQMAVILGTVVTLALSLGDALADARREAEAINQAMRSEHEWYRGERVRRIQERLARRTMKMEWQGLTPEELRGRMEKELAEINQRYDEAIARIRARQDADMESSIARMEDLRRAEIQAYSDWYERMIDEATRRAADAAEQEAEQKRLKTMEVIQFEKQMAERAHLARIQMIEDELEREIAAINARYDREIERAREIGADLQAVEAARAAEIEAARTRIQRQEAERAQREMQRLDEERQRFLERLDQEIVEARIDATLEGTERELAQLEAEKQRMLAEAARLGVEPEKIEELFRLRREAVMKAEQPDIRAAMPVLSGFSAFAIMAQAAGPVAETAQNTRRMARQLDNIRELLARNLVFA